MRLLKICISRHLTYYHLINKIEIKQQNKSNIIWPQYTEVSNYNSTHIQTTGRENVQGGIED